MKAWNCSLSTTTNVVVVGLFIMVCMLIMWFSFKKSRNQQYEDFTFILLHYKNWPLIVMFSAKNHGKHDWKINKIVKSNRKKTRKTRKKEKQGKSKKIHRKKSGKIEQNWVGIYHCVVWDILKYFFADAFSNYCSARAE